MTWHRYLTGLARNHIITLSKSKLLTIAGGKWTTFRFVRNYFKFCYTYQRASDVP